MFADLKNMIQIFVLFVTVISFAEELNPLPKKLQKQQSHLYQRVNKESTKVRISIQKIANDSKIKKQDKLKLKKIESQLNELETLTTK